MIDGFLNINKPAGMTSHDVVARTRRLFNQKRVGHLGTLDPEATGVLPVALGMATRLIEYFDHCLKSYQAQLTFGIRTDTEDAWGSILENQETKGLTLEQIEEILPEFKGDILQIPPMYSALKVQGKRLYELAREGKEVKREPRKVSIYSLEILNWENPKLDFSVSCSRGTYIRSLCRDMGERLLVGGHMSSLKRTAVGPFQLEDSVTLEKLERNLQDYIMAIDQPLSFLPKLYLDELEKHFVQHGKQLGDKDFNELIFDKPYTGNYLRLYAGDVFLGIAKFNKVANRLETRLDKIILPA